MFKTSLRLLATMILCATAASAQSSTMFRGSADHTGVYDSVAPKDITHVLWEFKTGARIFSSPVICDGIVYIGSSDHFLYAIDAGKGTQIWKFETGANVASTPAVSHGLVYFLSLDGNAYALDAHTGKLKWKFQTAGESRMSVAGLYGLAPSREVMPDPWDFFLSSPIVQDGLIFFGSGDHNVYALDAQTGQIRWKYLAADVIHSSPSIASGVLYVGCWDGAMYAINISTGKLNWKFATGLDSTRFMQGIPGSVAIADGIVVFGSRDSKIYALDATSGKQLWSQDNASSWVISSPAVRDGNVYITTSDTMKFRALDLKSGRTQFELPFRAYSFSSVAVAAGHAYFGSFDGLVYDVDLAARKFNSKFRVKAALNHKELLTQDGHLNLQVIYGPLGLDGKPNNTIDATIVGVDRLLQLGSVLSSPAVSGGVVYVASADGSVYALNSHLPALSRTRPRP